MSLMPARSSAQAGLACQCRPSSAYGVPDTDICFFAESASSPRRKGGSVTSILSTYAHRTSLQDPWNAGLPADLACVCRSLNPWSKSDKARAKRITPFYGLNDDLPILLAFVIGLQHSLAMLYVPCHSMKGRTGADAILRSAGVITPPSIFAAPLNLNGTPYANCVCR